MTMTMTITITMIKAMVMTMTIMTVAQGLTGSCNTIQGQVRCARSCSE